MDILLYLQLLFCVCFSADNQAAAATTHITTQEVMQELFITPFIIAVYMDLWRQIHNINLFKFF